jgi:hypothetical protein
VLLGGMACGCASVQPQAANVPNLDASQHCLLFVADGAGDFRQASKRVFEAADAEKCPLVVQPFIWSHGAYRCLADQCDVKHFQAAGRRLADLVIATHRAYPDVCINLLGHSAGCQVVLAAGEVLPPGSLQRIVLLNPSVECNYDLRPALRAACDGIDAHCSTKDTWYLGVVLGFVSGLHGKPGPAAGIAGFRPVIQCPEDEVLYTRLHHFGWHPGLERTGNDGGHYGGYQRGYLHKYVLPRLIGAPLEGDAD